jgi:hypothetical protein
MDFTASSLEGYDLFARVPTEASVIVAAATSPTVLLFAGM